MSNGAKRNILLDATKGLAIILVLFGHALETYIADHSAVSGMWHWAAIHHFHMALFIFISGYLAYGKRNSGWLQRRFFQLTLPFIIWSLVLYYWSSFSFSGLGDIYPLRSGLINNLLYSTWSLDASGLWFLPIVFAFCLLTYLTKGNPWAFLCITLVAYIISQVPLPLEKVGIPQTFWFTRIAWFMPFFAGGYLISQYRDKLKNLNFIKWIALIAFPAFFVLGGQLNYSPFIYSWPDYTTFIRLDLVSGFYTFWMALLGIGMSFAVVELLIKLAAVRHILGYLGGITLGIYCIHGMWRNIGFGDGIIEVISMTLVALLLSSALIWILQRSRVTDYLFLGSVQNLTTGSSGWVQVPLLRLRRKLKELRISD